MSVKGFRYLDFTTSLFITVLILSNLLSSAKIIDLNISIFSLALIFDAGTLVFPVSYIFGDILTEVYGYRRARRVIWSGFGASILVGFFVWLTAVLPGEALWEEMVGQTAYEAVLGGIYGLIVASITAYWLGAFSNSFILAKMKILTNGRWLWTRTIGSTIVGQAVDTTVFITIATALGVFPIELMVSLIVTNYILKVGIEVALTPITLMIVNWMKRAEDVDIFDRDTRFSPFTLDL